MLDHILRFALQQKLLMILAAVVLLGAGVFAWQKLPIDAFPDVTNVQVMMTREYHTRHGAKHADKHDRN